jgi:hypothetical protein
MLNRLQWIENKIMPVPHADELRGMTFCDMERKLRFELGYSKSKAKRFIHEHKARLRSLRGPQDE